MRYKFQRNMKTNKNSLNVISISFKFCEIMPIVCFTIENLLFYDIDKSNILCRATNIKFTFSISDKIYQNIFIIELFMTVG